VVIEEMIELNTMMATLDLVAQSEWCAILPELIMATRFCGQTFSVRELSPGFALKLVVIEPARHNRSPVTDMFIQALRVSCEELVGPEPDTE
jgi:LysR family nitrogen assimilation transcriptional regulator